MPDHATVPPSTDPRHRSSSDPVLALDLGGTQLRAAAVSPEGRILRRADRATPREADQPGIVAACRELLESVRDGLPERDRAGLAGVGISAPGPLDPRAGVLVEPPNLPPAYHGLALAAPLASGLGLPVVVERDTNVAAFGEWSFGAARGLTDFIYLTVSTGLGGSVVTGGRLLTGPDGVAGELGHLPVDLDGPVCGCGARGHLEALSSGTAIARAARELVGGGHQGELARIAERIAPAALAAVDVAAAEEAGDQGAAAIMERARGAFAAAIVGLVDVFDPERIIVGGGIAQGQGERWLGPAREAVARTAFRIPARRVTIVPAELGEDVGLIGALPLLAYAREPVQPAASSEPAGAPPEMGIGAVTSGG